VAETSELEMRRLQGRAILLEMLSQSKERVKETLDNFEREKNNVR